MPEADDAMRWIPRESRRAQTKAQMRTTPFVFNPENPDTRQARQSAYEWHGRLWSPFLYCYAVLGCRISSERFRRAVLGEVCNALSALDSNPEEYRRDEMAKLRNLKLCVESAGLTGAKGRRR